MATMYAQYGEEQVLLNFFEGKRQGRLVEIGAANGLKNSNSRFLIESYEWSGLLVEPHPTFFSELKKLYGDSTVVELKQLAVYSQKGTMPFYVYGFENIEPAQVSTLSSTFKDKVCKMYGDGYKEPIMVETDTLEAILRSQPEVVDFLSIDCEGVDMDVLRSNDWRTYRPTLVCIEHSMPQSELHEYMTSQGYWLLTRTTGNTFYVANGASL